MHVRRGNLARGVLRALLVLLVFMIAVPASAAEAPAPKPAAKAPAKSTRAKSSKTKPTSAKSTTAKSPGGKASTAKRGTAAKSAKKPTARSTTVKGSKPASKTTTKKPVKTSTKKTPARKTPAPKTAAKPAAKPAPVAATPEPPRPQAMLIVPPETRMETVVDTVFGVAIPDPYRWLEDDASPEVASWTRAQNAFTQAMLGSHPGRAEIRERLTRLLAVGTVSAPVERGGRYFSMRREGDQNQPVLMVRDSLGALPRVLLDPNALSKDATTSLDWYYPSPDGTLLAYGTSQAGSERSTLQVLEVATGENRPDRIPDTRAASLAWEPDGSGFYYTRYPKKGTVPAGEENYSRRIYHHRLGEDPETDPLVYGEGRDAQDWPGVELSEDGRWLVVSVSVGWSRNDVYLRDRHAGSDAPWVPLAEGADSLYAVDVVGDRLFITTNAGAPMFRVFRTSVDRPQRDAWQEIIPEADAVLQGITPIGGRLFALYQQDAASVLTVYDQDGVLIRDLPLPAQGTAGGVLGRPSGTEGFFGFSSFFVPPTVYRYDLAADSLTVFDRVETDIDTDRYEMRQIWYVSKDGTKVPLFVVNRRGVTLNGNNPCWLTGYGGFNVSMTPVFQRNVFLWLEQGGIYAMACLRGGGEYGEEWHQAGKKLEKQNVFDDFIMAADYLVRHRYTSPARLAIQGGSNGGLLVGAALTQRPDLFRAVVCQVPLLDMLRYHRFLIAKLWIPEYGSADDVEEFPALYDYSPYHRVVDGRKYPAVLLATAESDTRVAPLHARKMAARLQAASASGNPVLLRLESKAGHGAGKPVSKIVDEYTDIYSFLFSQLGMNFRETP